ncbi:MAG TPA: cell envelope biogenesis protein TolA [Allosphingosinicella sp.]
MDRAEAKGLGIATAGHAALLALLTYGVATTRLPVTKSDPIEVSFVEEVGLESTSPTPSAEAPAPLLAPEEGPAAPAMPAPPEVQPVPRPEPAASTPAPAPAPVPQPRPAPRPAPPKASPAPTKPAPSKPAAPSRPSPSKPAQAARPAPSKPAQAARPAATRPTGRLSGLLNGVSDRASASRSTTPPAAVAGPAVEASLVAEVRRQLKPHWQRAVPSGADAEALRTELSLTLGRDGRVTGIEVVRTTGITASNRPQVGLHQERARRAVTLASPFKLPDKYYDAWRQLNVTLDLRLSQ